MIMICLNVQFDVLCISLNCTICVTILNLCKWNCHVVSCHFVSYCIVLHHIETYRTVLYHLAPYRIVSYRIVLYCIISNCIMLYGVISYCVVLGVVWKKVQNITIILSCLHITSYPVSLSYPTPPFSFSYLCWKKFSRALQMVYLSWIVSRCSSCCPKVRPWTRMLGGRISATHCSELSTGERARSVGMPPPASSCSARVKVGGPSSTTRVGMAPLPWSIDTTFSWEEVLQVDTRFEWRHMKTHTHTHTHTQKKTLKLYVLLCSNQ